jgi:hypothetical protein
MNSPVTSLPDIFVVADLAKIVNFVNFVNPMGLAAISLPLLLTP